MKDRKLNRELNWFLRNGDRLEKLLSASIELFFKELENLENDEAINELEGLTRGLETMVECFNTVIVEFNDLKETLKESKDEQI